MGFKFRFLSAFREFLIYHHKSLEFRAKVFASIIAAKLDPDEDDFDALLDIASEIYDKDEDRKSFLVQTTKEYVSKVKKRDYITLDALLLSIDKDMKDHPRYAKKIDFSHLRRFINGCEDEVIVQQRVYEFLINEVKIYLPN
ncbi:hypothetical protein CR66_08335 [Campylobacter mucosalis]|uniref:hypothetical protein n=1 Tax=Campylobacter mucosalis TaxID=202 RepID=UPI0004D8D752|nr:hypothetical protein [Campylobacter mucosalis]KEA45368.1 hypothetical protein CR66_08335 [Campylobacter mucosalis]QKF62187.1 hypothetical protein CMCT_0008 [Campylobacter mucosalis]